jgi:hypothetical protein
VAIQEYCTICFSGIIKKAISSVFLANSKVILCVKSANFSILFSQIFIFDSFRK